MAISPAPRVIFRLLAGTQSGLGVLQLPAVLPPRSLCCRHWEVRAAGALPACPMMPCGSLHLPVTLALSIGHRAAGTVQCLRPVIGLERPFLCSLSLFHIFKGNITKLCSRVWLWVPSRIVPHPALPLPSCLSWTNKSNLPSCVSAPSE